MEGIFVLKLLAIIVVSYLIGNFNFAVVIARSKGVDIRSQGSGNPGTMNMLRTFGVGIGVLTLLLDALKGAIPALASYYFMRYVAPEATFAFGVDLGAPAYLGYYVSGFGKSAMLLGGFCAVIGHVFPVFNRFQGGKGVASTIGVFFAVDPVVTGICFLCGFLYLLLGKYGCVASFIVTVSTAVAEIVFALVWGDNVLVIILSALLIVLILVKHRKNLVRLAQGTEANANLIARLRRSREEKENAGGKA